MTTTVPFSSSASTHNTLFEVIPELEGIFNGMTFKVPTSDVSVLDITFHLENEATYEDISEKIKEASNGPMKTILGFTEEALVSSDFLGEQRACVVDLTAGVLISPTLVKLVAWYDNEVGLAGQVTELLIYMVKHE